MKSISNISTLLLLFQLCISCKSNEPKFESEIFQINTIVIDGILKGTNTYEDVNTSSPVYIQFSSPMDRGTVAQNIDFSNSEGISVPADYTCEKNDSVLKITPSTDLKMYSEYKINIGPDLKSKLGTLISSGKSISFTTGLDSTDKFSRISDEELLTLVQKQTFNYFWNFGHPTSGMARERSTSGNTVTTGGTGFGIMAMIVAAERGFISGQDAVARIQKIVGFLKNNCANYHGAFAHWIDGSTGATLPFSAKDNGADLVETSFLFEGLLAARQYFNGSADNEQQLRNDITQLWESVDWVWFQKNGQKTLYWHWSPDYDWDMNMPVSGWNECLITYVLAASSPTHPISKEVYEQGWARNGNMKNGQTYYEYTLPLGPANGGPLFFTHYSFLGLNPKGLSDVYADYLVQNTNHALINYKYCIANPQNHSGYSRDCWGLTASDGNAGYSAHSPTNDPGVIAPTAALASMPYTPEESMQALHFFYYKLGNLLWKEYGFVDAFNLSARWYDNQFLAIDQGPIIVMIENYRTGLLWNTFMSNPEIRNGLTKLGFNFQTN
ncbi:MAG: Ig-like domain-containing protein [Dysgonamonadaceae bacterium]|jgi:hypothetical protein|nr:Ig-like domain-containing protein [Dysgonamonadaceae bacterium]